MVVRGDLSPGAQIAQACHGLREFTEHFPELDRRWYKESNYIVVLNVDSEEHLLKLLDKLDERGVKYATFKEPDLEDSLTCAVIEPSQEAKRICRGLPLALNGCTR